jgi:hypothetical protein
MQLPMIRGGLYRMHISHDTGGIIPYAFPMIRGGLYRMHISHDTGGIIPYAQIHTCKSMLMFYMMSFM